MLKVSIGFLLVLVVNRAGATNGEIPAGLSAAQGKYQLDREASSPDCREPARVQVRIWEDRKGLSIRDLEAIYGGEIYAVSRNQKTGWDNVYDLYLFWQKASEEVSKNRAYSETFMISPFGFESEKRKFYFLNEGRHPFVISHSTKRLSYDYGYETTIAHCAYQRLVDSSVDETEAK